MSPNICRCCGFRIVSASGCNPNVCRDCDTLLIDDSPVGIARETIGSTGYQPVPSGNLPDGTMVMLGMESVQEIRALFPFRSAGCRTETGW